MIPFLLAQIQPVELTNVNQVQQEFIIDGGELAGDNIFHTFEQFNLDQGQIAEFLANPQTRNIFNRVIGGDPSIIDGILKVTGGSPDFYFLNPNGIIFGRNAYIDVPAAFYGSTASSVQFGNSGLFQFTGEAEWFSYPLAEDESLKESKISALEPSFLNFQTLTNPIINLGTIQAGGQINLSGSNVVSLGDLNAPDIKFSLVQIAFRGYKVSIEGDFWTYLPRDYIPIDFLDFRQVYQLNEDEDVFIYTQLGSRAVFVEHFDFSSFNFRISEIYLGDSLSNQQVEVFRLGSFGEDFFTDLNLAIQPEIPNDLVDELPDDLVIDDLVDPVGELPDDPVGELPDDLVIDDLVDPVDELPDDPVDELPDDLVVDDPVDPVDELPDDPVMDNLVLDDLVDGVTLGFTTSDFLKTERTDFIVFSDICYYPRLVQGDRSCLLRLNDLDQNYPEMTEENFLRRIN